ncbi:MAG: hypothetical protein II333_01335, partial [Clostridia bacterium]|nr:hypothetical protein [Clostridia bacterium]
SMSSASRNAVRFFMGTFPFIVLVCEFKKYFQPKSFGKGVGGNFYQKVSPKKNDFLKIIRPCMP